ncbi:MAG: hypothetical protein HY072_09845, partial [Deltaproteobacteria bacterium]|nr:hypothetical protein [Deltaproteobacteria bacterium]
AIIGSGIQGRDHYQIQISDNDISLNAFLEFTIPFPKNDSLGILIRRNQKPSFFGRNRLGVPIKFNRVEKILPALLFRQLFVEVNLYVKKVEFYWCENVYS